MFTQLFCDSNDNHLVFRTVRTEYVTEYFRYNGCNVFYKYDI